METNNYAFALPKIMISRNVLSALISAVILSGAGNLHAATNEWIGGNSPDWNDPNNWSLNAFPDKNTQVLINNGNVLLNGPTASWSLLMGIAANSDVSVTVNQGNEWQLGQPLSGSSANGFAQKIGDAGKAKLIIEDGGKVYYAANSPTILGNQVGSQGEVVVSGAGSVWSSVYSDVSPGSNQTILDIGVSGSGKLSVLNGGSVITPRGIQLAANQDSYGSVRVSGNGSTLLLGNDQLGSVGWAGISMGAGEGDVTVDNGGNLTLYGGLYFGRGKNGASQTVNVIGQGSTLNSYGDMHIAYDGGTGVLRIVDGAKLYSLRTPGSTFIAEGQGVIGDGRNQNGGNAIVYVSGSGSLWHMDQDAIVGYLANGSLNITNSATVENAKGRVGLVSGYTGTITVSGLGSAWNNSDNVTLGAAGNGILTVSDGGVVNVGNTLLIADQVGSTGTLNFGSAEGQAATATGTVNASQINFGAGDGRVVFNHNDSDYHFNHLLNGTGTVIVHGGETQFIHHQTYGGLTEIHNGAILKAGVENAFSANSTYNISNGGILDLAGYQQTLGNTTNAGSIKLHTDGIANGHLHNLLTIDGDYHSDNGEIVYNTVLGNDSSATDKLLIKGNSSGTGYVRILNAGGNGAQTLNGIKIIDVLGQSDAEFFKADNHRIVAGAYEYDVVRGKSDDKNWYLTSTCVNGNGNCDNTIDPPPIPEIEIFRPEVAIYSANLAIANTLFTHSLHDRLGEPQYTDSVQGQIKNPTSLWLRIVGGHTRSRDTTEQMKTQTNRVIIHGGGDIANWSNSELDRGHLGLMFGYGKADSNSDSRITGYGSRGSVDGYSSGIYGTWYSNDVEKTGLYVDSWAQYNWFKNEVKGQYIGNEKYHSDGVVVSLESGYTFKVIDNPAENKKAFIQPQAQVVWMNVRADDHTESNGTQVSGTGDGNVMTRLGIRAYLQGYHPIDQGKDRLFQPFVETNWIHNSKAFGSKLNGARVEQKGTKNMAELKLGVEGQLTGQFTVWSNVSQRIGDDGYSDTTGLLGVKYAF